MKTESIKELVDLCRAGHCFVKLEAGPTGVVATVSAIRGDVSSQTTAWLDKNETGTGAKLEAAVRRVQ